MWYSVSAYKKYFLPAGAAILSAIILSFISVIDFPNMGHDYAYVVPLSIDLSSAWNKFGVLSPHFSALRCLGLPVWANPNSLTFSLLHLFSLFLDPVTAIVVSYAVFALAIFTGAYLFAGLFIRDVFTKVCFAIGWTLQAKLALSVMVGHYTYLMLGLFPLIAVLLIQKQKTRVKEILVSLGLVILFAQFVFNGALYAIFIWTPSMLLAGGALFFMGYDFALTKADAKYLIKRNLFALAGAVTICIPKISAVYSWMSNYPRHISFFDAGIFKVLQYSFFNLFLPVPFDAQSSVGWEYGNWESNQTVFPFLGLAILVFFAVKRNFADLKKLVLFLTAIFSVSVLINSGIYADLFSKIPLLSSMHVNPRWNTIILLPLFAGYAFLVSKNQNYFIPKYWAVLSVIFFVFPFLYFDREGNGINYGYMRGYKAEVNRLSYCYEPIFGYKTEDFPASVRKLQIFGNKLVDPRCYLKNSGCEPGTIINEQDQKLLEEYKLE